MITLAACEYNFHNVTRTRDILDEPAVFLSLDRARCSLFEATCLPTVHVRVVRRMKM